MNFKLFFLFRTRLVIAFCCLCSLYIIYLFVDHFFILTQDIYVKAMGNSIISNNQQNIILNFKNNFLLNIAITPLVIIFQILAISSCLIMGFILKEIKFTFLKIVEAVTISLLIFPLVDILLSIGLVLFKNISTIQDTIKPDWHSLLFFFNRNAVPTWLIYPLKTVNLAEVGFLIILFYELNHIFVKKTMTIPVFLTAFTSYCIGLIFWIVLVLFFSINATS